MAKLNFKKYNNYFELEVDDEVFSGTLNDQSKSQKAEQDKVLSPKIKLIQNIRDTTEKISRKQSKLNTKNKLQDWEAVDILEDEIFLLQDEVQKNKDELLDFVTNTQESLFEKRIEDTVESKDKKEIMEACKKYGYENVFNTILQDIKERNEKK